MAIEAPVLIINDTECLKILTSETRGGKHFLTLQKAGSQPVIGYRLDSKHSGGIIGGLAKMDPWPPGIQPHFIIPMDQLEQDATNRQIEQVNQMSYFR